MADTIHVLIPSAGGPIPGIWYPVAHAPGALVMVGGAGGGTHGPSGMYVDVRRPSGMGRRARPDAGTLAAARTDTAGVGRTRG